MVLRGLVQGALHNAARGPLCPYGPPTRCPLCFYGSPTRCSGAGPVPKATRAVQTNPRFRSRFFSPLSAYALPGTEMAISLRAA
eukprot:2873529-Rhodomonas_salina.1